MKKTFIVIILFLVLTAGLTFLVKPSREASVTIVSHTGSLWDGKFYVYGEVQNLDTAPVYFVQINATFYDSSNNMIAEETGYCGPYHILPNQKASFSLYADVDETESLKIDHYTLETFVPFEDTAPPTPPLGLKILSSDAVINAGWIEVTGEIENVGTTSISNLISIIGTCYDSDGKVIDVGYDHILPTEIDPILPGQKSSFMVLFRPEVVPLAKSYVLTAQSDEYICYEYPELPTPTPSTPSVTILSYSPVRESSTTEGKFYSVYGEVQNLGTVPLYLEINASFYDSTNVLVTQGYGYCGAHLLPNRKTPFIVNVNVENEAQVSRIDHSVLEPVHISAYSTTEFPLNFKILSSSANIDPTGSMTITGEIENTGTTNVPNNIDIFTTCYDLDGKVIFVNGDSLYYSSLDPMIPGQKSSFEMWVPADIVALAKSYSLTAESIEYACIEYPESPILASSQTPETPPSDTSVPPPDASAPALDTSVWVAPPQNAAVATTVTVVAVGTASVVAAAVSNTAGTPAGRLVEKTGELIPESVKKWFSDYISSKRESTVEAKTGSYFLPTKSEALAYIVSLAVLTLSFSYVKANDLTQILSVLPNILVSAVIIEFVKTFVLEVFAKSRGVWTEHKIWYLGLAMFLVTTFAFGIPFSSPSRNVYHTTKLTKRLEGIVSSIAILVVLAFAALFFVLMVSGFVLIGSTGLAMCSIMAFLDTFPVAPMNGKSIYKYNKLLWLGLFGATLTLYASWLLLL